MTNYSKNIGILLCLLMFSVAAQAVDFSFQPRLEAGMMYYSYEQDDLFFTDQGVTPGLDMNDELVFAPTTRVVGSTDVEFSDVMPFIGGGLTVFADRFFIDISGLKAYDGEDSDRQQTNITDTILWPAGVFDPVLPVTDVASTSYDLDVDVDFDRTELNFSFGYAVTDRFVVFGGYRRSETDFDYKQQGIAEVSLVSTEPLNLELVGDFSSRFSTTFEQKGPFIGGNYSWPIDKGVFRGTLSSNVAVAFLDAEIKQSTVEQSLNNAIVTDNLTGEMVAIDLPLEAIPSTDFDGDTVGFTFGIAWRGLTSVDGLTYSIGVNGYSYNFDADDNFVADVSETQIKFQGGIAYSF